MGLFKSKKGSIISDYFMVTKDVANLKAGVMTELSLYDDYLQLRSVKLKYDQITDVYYGVDTEITNKNKSVIGRAVAGGLLFGGAGAVVGAISGSGKKEVKTQHFLFIISYISGSGDDDFISLEDTRLYKGMKIYKKLKELSHITTPEYL